MAAMPISFKIDFSQKPNTTNFRSIFYLNMLSAIFSVIVEGSYHQKLQFNDYHALHHQIYTTKFASNFQLKHVVSRLGW